MDNILWLTVANAVIWLGMGGYLCYLWRAQVKINKKLSQLEQLHDSDKV